MSKQDRCLFLCVTGNVTQVPPINLDDTTRNRRSPVFVDRRSSSSSSLSSLSQLDEAVAFAEQQIEKENRRENKSKQTILSGQTDRKGSNSVTDQPYRKGGNAKLLGFDFKAAEMPGRKDSKTVTFGTEEEIHDLSFSAEGSKVNVSDVIVNGKNDTDSVENGGKERMEDRKNAKIIVPVACAGNPVKENGDYDNGSVNAFANHPKSPTQSAMQPVLSYTHTAQNGERSPSAVNETGVCVNPPSPALGIIRKPIPYTQKSADNLDNETVDENTTGNQLSPPPVSTSVIDRPNPEKRAERPKSVPIRLDTVSSVAGSKPEFLPDVFVADEAGSTATAISDTSGAQPPPPPPPPPPAPVLDGNQAAKTSVPEEIKKKTASLPARFVVAC